MRPANKAKVSRPLSTHRAHASGLACTNQATGDDTRSEVRVAETGSDGDVVCFGTRVQGSLPPLNVLVLDVSQLRKSDGKP